MHAQIIIQTSKSNLCLHTFLFYTQKNYKLCNLNNINILWNSMVYQTYNSTKHAVFLRQFYQVLLIYLTRTYIYVQKVKDIKLVGPDGKMTDRQRLLTKSLWLLSTARNALAVVVCSVIAYVCHTHGHTPFVLTGWAISYVLVNLL